MNQSSQLPLMIPCRCSYNEHNSDRDLISPNLDSLLSGLAGNENKKDHLQGDIVLMLYEVLMASIKMRIEKSYGSTVMAHNK